MFYRELKKKDLKTGKSLLWGKGMVPPCAVINQLWAWLFSKRKNNFLFYQQPILQLVDNCTSGIVAFPLYTDFPAKEGYLSSESTATNKYHVKQLPIRRTLFSIRVQLKAPTPYLPVLSHISQCFRYTSFVPNFRQKCVVS